MCTTLGRYCPHFIQGLGWDARDRTPRTWRPIFTFFKHLSRTHSFRISPGIHWARIYSLPGWGKAAQATGHSPYEGPPLQPIAMPEAGPWRLLKSAVVKTPRSVYAALVGRNRFRPTGLLPPPPSWIPDRIPEDIATLRWAGSSPHVRPHLPHRTPLGSNSDVFQFIANLFWHN